MPMIMRTAKIENLICVSTCTLALAISFFVREKFTFNQVQKRSADQSFE